MPDELARSWRRGRHHNHATCPTPTSRGGGRRCRPAPRLPSRRRTHRRRHRPRRARPRPARRRRCRMSPASADTRSTTGRWSRSSSCLSRRAWSAARSRGTCPSREDRADRQGAPGVPDRALSVSHGDAARTTPRTVEPFKIIAREWSSTSDRGSAVAPRVRAPSPRGGNCAAWPTGRRRSVAMITVCGAPVPPVGPHAHIRQSCRRPAVRPS